MATDALPHHLQADTEAEDSLFRRNTDGRYIDSLASDIRKGTRENGRVYAAYGNNEIGLPIDEQEQDRNDLQHCKFILILNNQLHLAPMPPNPGRILDLGTGSGIWAIDIADRYPEAEVIGVDVAPVQPSWVPPNCHFEIDDIENDWLYGHDLFDFIHGRELLLSIRNWDRVITQSFASLKPGRHLELSATIPQVGSDDNTMPEDSAYVQLSQAFFEIGDMYGASVRDPFTWKARMERAGFVDVHEQYFKIPVSPWPRDPRLKHIGAFEVANLERGAEGFVVRGMTGLLGRSVTEVQVLCAKARAEARNPRIHAYIYFAAVYGRKPEA